MRPLANDDNVQDQTLWTHDALKRQADVKLYLHQGDPYQQLCHGDTAYRQRSGDFYDLLNTWLTHCLYIVDNPSACRGF